MDSQSPPSPSNIRTYTAPYVPVSTGTTSGTATSKVSRTYESAASTPLESQQELRQKLPYRSAAEPPSHQQQQQQQQQQYATLPYSTQPLAQLPPQPTHSTSGSVVGGVGGMKGASLRAPMMTQSPGPMNTTALTASTTNMQLARSRAEAAVDRLADLQQQYRQHLQYGAGAANVPGTTAAAVRAELRAQTGVALAQLRDVRKSVAMAAKEAENHRFRRWLVGGFLATFIPLVRRLFRRRSSGSRHARPSSSSSTAVFASNSTEYAFARSRELVDRLLKSERGGVSRLASMAFFVFAVLYVFSNEVTLRVARTVARRLKKLSIKMERGDEPLNDGDLEQLTGWRWRVLLWGKK
ncbi:hypothetical protein CMQ_1270 [Grosmannia clavigera kw1407]|uniref:Uncharacterized protein n=1 Tax=Grosmannia clavigera (strain kw1407 / UAMH 11150) TaxID=655863 RepID=F0XCE9_GROCL|nr:uncharacterized protein CMQ_1270 [Grosmannia clavigera kw1407]EFX04342.1 hypothetical protein CMQ_1270 [Grosmannia clavigera kw1407]